MEKVTHDSIEPVYRFDSKILILGSIPSPKSREYGFYYGHPQNKFWKVLAEVFNVTEPLTIEEKKAFLYKNYIALWDVLESCMINGADDSSIKEPVPNDIKKLLNATNIKRIYTTGKKAYDLYNKLCLKDTGAEAILLPSTSPANCRFYKYSDLVEAYRIIKSDI